MVSMFAVILDSFDIAIQSLSPVMISPFSSFSGSHCCSGLVSRERRMTMMMMSNNSVGADPLTHQIIIVKTTVLFHVMS